MSGDRLSTATGWHLVVTHPRVGIVEVAVARVGVHVVVVLTPQREVDAIVVVTHDAPPGYSRRTMDRIGCRAHFVVAHVHHVDPCGGG